jgi:uncharacterized membrane protein
MSDSSKNRTVTQEGGTAVSANELTMQNVRKIARLEQSYNQERTLGECVADKFASFVGSWPFIIGQSAILGLWVILNITAWIKHWDPYPFILLNLTLSFQAAYAGPIIMMSQNRQTRLSERRNHLDLQINLLSEQENTQMLHLLRKIAERLEIDYSDVPELSAMEETVEPTNLLQQIEKTVEGKQKAG